MSQQNNKGMATASWAGEQGDKWQQYVKQFEGMIAPVGNAALDHANFKLGEKVVDIGCGAGPTTFEIANRVGQEGQVTGLDVSQTLINTANQRLAENGANNVEFICADAAATDLSGYDCLFSRFGVMFFDDPYLAFSNMRKFLKPDGRARFACWGPPPRNAWVFNFMDIVKQFVDIPPPVPNAPGPFAFGDKEYLHDILEKAGFRDIEFIAWEGPQILGGPGSTPQEAARFMIEATFVGDAIADQPDDIKQKVLEEITAELSKYVVGNNVEMSGCSWLVSAKA